MTAPHLRIAGIVERRTPLPPGRYWITVYAFPSDLERKSDFFKWTESNAQTLIVDKEEALPRPSGGVSPGAFYIFTILQPTAWLDAKRFGFPNVAGPEIQSASDTTSRPPVPTPGSVLSELLDGFFSSPVGRFALVAGLVVLLTRSGDK